MARLVRKTELPYVGKVHDLTVSNSHSYNVEGLGVHNSAGGSLLSYVLNITQMDPIKHGLLFERFLATKKKGYPDIDCLSSNIKVLGADQVEVELGNLHVGDYVLDLNNIPQRVLAVQHRLSNSDDQLWTVVVSTNGVYGSFLANHKHRVFLEDESVERVGKLVVGDRLHSACGVSVVTHIVPMEKRVQLTDITVEGTASFQIVPFDVLVEVDENHNKSRICHNTYHPDTSKHVGCELHSHSTSKLTVSSHNSDFSDRDQAVKLLISYFGEENVVPVSNFAQLQLRSLIKDVARFHNLPFAEINSATSRIEAEVLAAKKKEPGFDRGTWTLTYDEAEEHSPSFQTLMSKYPEFEGTIKVLFKQMRNISRHAGGVIITENSREAMPLIKSGGELQTPWPEGVNYRHLEEFGLLKFDILGLGTLRMFENCIRKILIKSGVKNPTFAQVKQWFWDNLHPDNNPLNDQKVFKNVFWDGRFSGIFQFVNENTQRFMAQMKPKTVLDIAIATSIFRPGPLSAQVDRKFLENRAHPENVTFKHPLLKEVFAETSGLLIFQEQLQMIYHKLAGVPLDETDGVRKAFTKKDISNLAKAKADRDALRESFTTLCQKTNNISPKVSGDIFDEMEKLVSYSFNKSCQFDTLVNTYTKDGVFVATKQIADITPGEYVKSRDEATKQLVFVEVVANHDHGVIDVFEFEFDNGKKVSCTLDHKFRVTDGRMLPIKQVLAEELEVVFDAQTMVEVASIKYIGKQQTHDLEVNHPDHQFYLANGALTSNSHAMAYAITSYQCAHFLTYFPDEWITTYIDYSATSKGAVTGKEDPKSVAIKEAKRLGYVNGKADINVSEYEYTLHPTEVKTLIPGFGSLKHVGKTVMSELNQFRPYKSLEDLVVNPDGTWRHSKFNKRALSTLIQLEALGSVGLVGEGKMFANYKQLHTVVIGGYDTLKRISSRKKNNDVSAALRDLTAKVVAEQPEDWTTKEKIAFQQELAGSVDFDLLMPPEVQKTLDELGVSSIDNWDDDPDLETQRHWGIVSSIAMATTKTGKPYLKLKFYAEANKEYTCFVWNYKAGTVNVTEGDIVVCSLKKNDFGLVSWPNKIYKVNT